MSQRAAERSPSSAGGRALAVVASRDRVTVPVRGEIDATTAPALGTLLSALVDQGCQHIEIDAAGVEFMDAAGLRVIVTAIHRLAPVGGELAIVASSSAVAKILAITDLAAVVGGPESSSGRRSRHRCASGSRPRSVTRSG